MKSFLTVFLIILMTWRVDSLQAASSGRDRRLSGPQPRVDRCRDWEIEWFDAEDRLSPPVWEFFLSLLDGPEGRLDSVFWLGSREIFVSFHPASTTNLLEH